MYHFDESRQRFEAHLVQVIPPTSLPECIILRDLAGRLSCHLPAELPQIETVLSQLESNLQADSNLLAYCATPPVWSYEPKHPLWVRLNQLAKNGNGSIKIVERVVAGQTWSKPTAPPFDPPPYLITFYSFKGGVGRTTAAALTGLKLARSGKKVCLVDFDLEAPGLSGLAENVGVGAVDYLLEKQLGIAGPMKDYLYFVADEVAKNKGGELWLVPAGNINANYLTKIGRLDFQALLQHTPSHSNIHALFHDLKQTTPFDFYLIDARTGITDIGGITLNGLSHLNVILFGLGSQNEQGLDFILQHLKTLFKEHQLTPEQIASRLLFVFSPVPLGESKAKDDDLKEALRQTLFTALETHIYPLWPLNTSFPDITDNETPTDPVPHDPLFIRYLPRMPLQKKLQEMEYIQSDTADPPYDQLVERILNVKIPLLGLPKNDPYPLSPNLLAVLQTTRQNLANLRTAGTADDDLKTEDLLRQRFLPLPSFSFLFDPNLFLILGPKGSGKSALFQVLKHPNYVKDLAAFWKIEPAQRHAVQRAKWLVGFEKSFQTSHFGPEKLQALDQVGRQHPSIYILFWKYLAVWSIQQAFHYPRLDLQPGPNLSDLLLDSGRMAQIDQFLQEVIAGKFEEQGQIYLIYDDLDRLLPTTNIEGRGRFLDGLIDWWQSYVSQQHLLAKIFLREDIFNREIKFEDKSKIREGVNRDTINWASEENHYRLFLKWGYEGLRNFVESQLPDVARQFVENPHVGWLPPTDSNSVRRIIEALVGEFMGGGKKKGFTYTWISRHLQDSNKQILPRWIIALFAKAANLAINQQANQPIVPPRIIRQALQQEVSGIAISDLIAAYGNEFQVESRSLFDSFREFSTFPQSRTDLLAFMATKGLNGTEVLKQLQEIGLLELRLPNRRREVDHYQIPDIYLYGLGLTRRGS